MGMIYTITVTATFDVDDAGQAASLFLEWIHSGPTVRVRNEMTGEKTEVELD